MVQPARLRHHTRAARARKSANMVSANMVSVSLAFARRGSSKDNIACNRFRMLQCLFQRWNEHPCPWPRKTGPLFVCCFDLFVSALTFNSSTDIRFDVEIHVQDTSETCCKLSCLPSSMSLASQDRRACEPLWLFQEGIRNRTESGRTEPNRTEPFN